MNILPHCERVCLIDNDRQIGDFLELLGMLEVITAMLAARLGTNAEEWNTVKEARALIEKLGGKEW